MKLSATKKTLDTNTNIVHKSSEGTTVVKKGVPLDHEAKHNSHKCSCSSDSPIVGVSLGITKNMDNYESLRVDCWISDKLQGDETKEEALNRLTGIVEKHLEEVVLNYIDD